MALINHKGLKPRDRLLLRLLYASGSRVSEIINLQWRHVQPSGDSGQITVTGKGGKTRAIKLSVATWKALQEFGPPDASADDYVFQSQRRQGQEQRRGQLDRTAVNIVRKAGRLDRRAEPFATLVASRTRQPCAGQRGDCGRGQRDAGP